MEENCSIPSPINLNCWKHQAGFIKKQISLVKSEKDIEKIKSSLLKIGESQMDLYFGKLTTADISKQIISHLKKGKNLDLDKYINWLKDDGSDYKLVQLSDKSIWTLRLSENKERYMHIHPGRYSPHTIRAKAITLKTAILILCFEQAGELEIVNTEAINQIRKEYLNEPPIRAFSSAGGIRRVLRVLRK